MRLAPAMANAGSVPAMATCSRCEFEAPRQSAVCAHCGYRLPRPCPACGFTCEADFAFCPKCGTVQMPDGTPPATASSVTIPSSAIAI